MIESNHRRALNLRWTTRRGPKVLLLVCSVVIGLAFAESAARLTGWGDVVLFVPNQSWGFLMKPSQVVYTYGLPVRINSLGLRGPEVAEPKPRGTTRIVFVGDSVVYGGGRIAEEQLFVRRVELRARSVGLSVEAINLSAPAWSPQNWWGYIQKNGLFNANMVVLVLPECDLARRFTDMALGGHWNHAPRLRLESLFRKVMSQYGRQQLSASQSIDEVISANLNAVIGLKEKCRDIPFKVVLVPSQVPRRPDEKTWSRFTPHLAETIDLREELQVPEYFMDGSHLSVAGHEFVAEQIFGEIRSIIPRDDSMVANFGGRFGSN
jgi:hypothetical protein